jgi:hypothetical protein
MFDDHGTLPPRWQLPLPVKDSSGGAMTIAVGPPTFRSALYFCVFAMSVHVRLDEFSWHFGLSALIALYGTCAAVAVALARRGHPRCDDRRRYERIGAGMCLAAFAVAMTGTPGGIESLVPLLIAALLGAGTAANEMAHRMARRAVRSRR